MEKVIVGISGGVDSAVCALLLKEAGYDVTGITLRTWQADDGTEGRCCEIDDAREIANKIGIPFYPINCLEEFRKKIIEPFASEYLDGKTPNPCIECNRYVKWDKLMYYANVTGAKYIATGHYASVIKLPNGRYTVKRAAHAEKDQTYMLYKLTQEQLAATLMPLGDYSKEEVRRIAKDAGLPVYSKPDSQDVCFVPDGDYSAFIRKAVDAKFPGEGNYVDEEGNVIGRHLGIDHYTVGQRKGLGIALGHPAYVKEILADRNEVVIGDESSLYCKTVYCRDVNFLAIPGIEPGERLECGVKIRYRHDAKDASIENAEGGVRITFDEPVKSATPGQSAVFYDGDGCVIGGGVIEKTEKY